MILQPGEKKTTFFTLLKRDLNAHWFKFFKMLKNETKRKKKS